MTELSPAAQAVLDEVLYKMCAGESESYAQMIAAVALQAAVDQVVPEQIEPPCGENEPWPQSYQLMSDSKWEQRQETRRQLLAIAAELSGTNNTSQEDFDA